MSPRKLIRIAWFGTSIMEHLEGYSPGMFNQAALARVGHKVKVESWRNRGYVQRLHLSLQADWPGHDFRFINHARGGATSRDILGIARRAFGVQRQGDLGIELAFLGCGINDVWRLYQGRDSEAVNCEEYESNYRQILVLLIRNARFVVCIGETPFGWSSELDVVAINGTLTTYNAIATRSAAEAGAGFVDVWSAFTAVAGQLGSRPTPSRLAPSLWADGVHLSELGDTIILHKIEQYLREAKLIESLAVP